MDTHVNARTVKQLRLRLGADVSRERARIAIEDGLACADFGDCGRLILVRRLSLPAFTGEIDGPAAARAIEASFRSLLPYAVHALESAAASAPIVWFEDRSNALLAALTVRLQGAELSQWFWRKVDPVLRDGDAEPSVIFERVVALDSGAMRGSTLRALGESWRSWTAPMFERFLACLPDPLPWAPEPVPAITHIYMTEPRVQLNIRQQGRMRVAAAARLSPAKAQWVARAELLASGDLAFDSPVTLQRARISALIGLAADSALSSVRRGDGDPRIRANFVPSTPGDDPLPSESIDRSRPDVAHVEALALPPWLRYAIASTHAGFFMLLAAARAVGFDEWIERQPRELHAAIRDVWLGEWAKRLNLAPKDPQREAWDANDAFPLQARGALRTWRLDTRRWLRTQARISPAALVRRAGLVVVTHTHIDVAFSMRDIDLRLRRAGLDQNPGWTPWLGRIVTFHFVELERGHA